MLDFTIYSDTERTKAVEGILEESKRTPSASELEAMANYILFGKDSNDQNAVDRGEVEIETKYKSYKKKKSDSLDEMMENPLFDERNFKPLSRTVYTNPKPVLDKSLPELLPLVEEIEKWQAIYDDAVARANSPNPPKTKTQIYKLKHFLIDLKKQQYIIQEAVRSVRNYPTPSFYSPIYTEDIGTDVAPLGLKIGEPKRFIDPHGDTTTNFVLIERTDTLNLENPHHIYALLEFYSLLLEDSLDNPYGSTKYLLETLDFFINKTYLEESRLEILSLKKDKVSNSEIRQALEQKFGLSYNENYISTIYTKEICKKIADTVTLHKDHWVRRTQPEAWKQCGCCGEWKLKDSREFVRKKSSLDGYTNRCKVCDREKRQEKKNRG